MLDWEDLKHLVALERQGSTLAAARALGVSQSTVQRRLERLGAALGQPVARRTSGGYVLTAFGASLAPQALEAAGTIERLAAFALAAGTEAALIRLTCPEPIVPRLSPLIDRFHAENPRLRVQLIVSDRYVDLAAGEADVALRSGDTDADLFGRKIADSVWAVYASRGYIQQRGRPTSVADLTVHDLITLDERVSKHRIIPWMKSVAPNAVIAARTTSVLGLIEAARAGLGVAPLPANLGDADPALVRVLEPVAELARTWKLLTPRSLRREPRIAALFDFVLRERKAFSAVLN